MKKNQKVLKTTTDSHTYMRARILYVTGCCLNCKRRHRKDTNSWKSNRKTKWKE